MGSKKRTTKLQAKTIEELKQILIDTEKIENDYPKNHREIIKINILKEQLKTKINKALKLNYSKGGSGGKKM